MEKTELKMPNLLTPDPLSGLIQLNARRLGVDLKWGGKGLDDLMLLIQDDSNKTILSKELWTGLQELWGMPELSSLPEPIHAKICSIILKARALTDLSLAKRNARAEGKFGAQPAPTDSGPARSL